MRLSVWGLLVVLIVIGTACGEQGATLPPNTPTPVVSSNPTPLPVPTLLPADTPSPTAVPTPVPTDTPSPTAAPTRRPIPTATPTPPLASTPAITAALPAPPAKVIPWPAVPGRELLVTNITDEVNGNTSSIDALLASPGADGISLREALIAANTTENAKTIKFAAALKGGTIRLQPDIVPPLTSGSLTIDGDIDGDGAPDITLDGLQAKQGLVVRSSGNTIAHLHLINFRDKTITFACTIATCEPRVIQGNRIIGNVIETSGRLAISIEAQGLVGGSPLYHDLAWEDTEIIGNTITAGPNTAHIVLRPGSNGGTRNRISRITISGNHLTGGRLGIHPLSGDETSIERGDPPPIRYSDDNLIEDVTISDNVLTGIKFMGIVLQAANVGNRGNRIVRVLISGNKITATERPIVLTSASGTERLSSDQDRSTSRNIISDVEVRGNLIEPIRYRAGIQVVGGGKGGELRAVPVTENRIERVAILDNEITVRQPGVAAIRILGGVVHGLERVAENIVTDVTISANRISADLDLKATGIEVIGGWIDNGTGTAEQNEVRNIVIRENSMSGVSTAIALLGGRKAGSTGNAIMGYLIEANELGGAPVRIVANDDGAGGNSVR